MSLDEPGFLVDTMCGRLSRWLRILGYDTDWLSEKERHLLIVRCLKESRILITRDHRFSKTRGIKKLILESDTLKLQIRQILKELNLKPDKTHFFHRCTFCNVIVNRINKETIVSAVPPYIYETHQHFYQCPQCNRTYWDGTHLKLFQEQLEKILEK